MSGPQIEKYLGIKLGEVALAVRKGMGHKRGILNRVNWDLPSTDIDRIWSVLSNYAGSRRYPAYRRPPLWDKRRPMHRNSPELTAAIAAEEAKVQQLRNDILAEAEGRSEDLPSSVRRWL
jgi:hypothetical protein